MMKALVRVMLAAAVTAGAAVPARALGPGDGEVTGVRVQPAPGRAELFVAVRGSVEVTDFTLDRPHRVVVDIAGARLGAAIAGYDGLNRAGVRDVRYAQYQPDVVRVVLVLDGPKDYRLERNPDGVRVTFAADRPFVAWSSTVAATTTALGAEPEIEEPWVPADTGDKPSVTARPAGALAAQTVGSTSDPYDDEARITVTWDAASIADVIAGFAAFSGRTIILGKDVKGEVTAEIKNQPWPQAFQAILAAHGLSAQEMPGGIIRVDAPATLAALDSLEPLETAVVRVNYKQAGALQKSVESVVTKNRGRVVADTSSNSLIITDTRSRIDGIADFVRGLDVRTPQVSIQAKIIFVDRSDIEQLGVKYDLGTSSQFFNKVVQRPNPLEDFEPYDKDVNIIDLGGNSLAGIGNGDATISGSAIDLVFSTAIGGFSLTSFLQALERSELSDVQAEPVITTLDNQTADILVGEETPLRVIDASAQGGAGGAPRATVQFKETGIRLTVTPHVTNNRQILMELRTERSGIQPLAQADLGFTIQKQQASNQLLVNDGETAVIGGLTVTTVTRSRAGIPLLSGLPILGKLFSYSTDSEARRDLIILVTPRIIDDGAEQ